MDDKIKILSLDEVLPKTLEEAQSFEDEEVGVFLYNLGLCLKALVGDYVKEDGDLDLKNLLAKAVSLTMRSRDQFAVETTLKLLTKKVKESAEEKDKSEGSDDFLNSPGDKRWIN